MSKYIAIIDLPDRKACNYCHALDCCFGDGTGRCPILDREIVRDGITWNRPSDCPLIPVDRVMEQIWEIDEAMTGDDWRGNPLDDVRRILQDELGVTEC